MTGTQSGSSVAVSASHGVVADVGGARGKGKAEASVRASVRALCYNHSRKVPVVRRGSEYCCSCIVGIAGSGETVCVVSQCGSTADAPRPTPEDAELMGGELLCVREVAARCMCGQAEQV